MMDKSVRSLLGEIQGFLNNVADGTLRRVFERSEAERLAKSIAAATTCCEWVAGLYNLESIKQQLIAYRDGAKRIRQQVPGSSRLYPGWALESLDFAVSKLDHVVAHVKAINEALDKEAGR